MTENRESDALLAVPAGEVSEEVSEVAPAAENIETTDSFEATGLTDSVEEVKEELAAKAELKESAAEEVTEATASVELPSDEPVSAAAEEVSDELFEDEDDDLADEEEDELILPAAVTEPVEARAETKPSAAESKEVSQAAMPAAPEAPSMPVQAPIPTTDVFGQTSYDGEPPVIVFEGVHKEYEGQVADSVALTDVSFSINKGEFVFIVGPSGSGKSTMIRLMMREIAPSGGKIYIAGKELAKLRRSRISKYRRNIGIVFQDFRLLPDRSVFDNVAFAQRVVGAPRRKIPKEVSKVLHLVGLSQKYKSFPNELSGGEQQRVAIARALVNNPMIILADEPTGNLDPQNSQEIMSLLEEINRRGTTVVIVTHDREVVDKMQKRVIMLNGGTIVEDKKGGYGRG